jgi:hypothetical protein
MSAAPQLRLAQTAERGLIEARALVQDPDVRLVGWDLWMPVLLIEEGGVAIVLQFADRESFHRFQGRVAALKASPHDPRRDP